MLDAASIKLAAQGVTGAGAAGVTWIAAAGEWSLALFGIPLSVLLCAAIGAFGVLSFMQTPNLRRAVASAVASTMLAAISVPLTLHAAGRDATPLPNALGPGVAVALAVALQLLLPWIFTNGSRLLSEAWARLLRINNKGD